MIGFVTSQAIAQAINDGVAAAQTSRDLPVYWLPGMYQIHQGAHAGSWFISADDDVLATPLRGNPAMTPQDFPEFPQLLSILGGLEARVDIEPSALTPL